MVSQPFILQLPVELCENLFTECGLSRQDLKSLRLTCKSFAVSAEHALSLALITISRLKAHRDVFEQTARDPLRARYVKEIVWEDLLDFKHTKPSTESPAWAEFELLTNAACDMRLFWAPKTYVHNTLGNSSVFHKRSLYDSDWLVEGIKTMRNLTTITVRPMRGWRDFTYESRLIRAAQYGASAWGITQHYSLGLMLIRPVLNQPECKVRALNLSIDMPDDTDLRDTQAFQYLTTIDICVFVRPDDTMGLQLRRALEAARNLRELKLRFRGSTNTQLKSWTAHFVEKLLNAARWPLLHSFHLADAPTVPSDATSYFCTAIANLGPQLHSLTLDGCGVTYEILDLMREQQTFPRLQSFTIRSLGRRARQEVAVSEIEVLAFLRNEIADLRSTTASVIPVNNILYTEILGPERLLSNPFCCRHLDRHPSVRRTM
ncbi:hypothetical protein F4824DRAFT_510439 [Ustulina deusta]|nr:hypothetical protein F4824DRAFT_510439 [Ustulina deusta]